MTHLIEVKKKDGESNESLLRRFNRKVQASGVILYVKDNQFSQKAKSKNLTRRDAQRRSKMRELRDYMRKIGKLDDSRDQYGRSKSTTKIHIKK